MFKQSIKVVVLIAVVAGTWWWFGAREESAQQVSVQEVSYEAVMESLDDGAAGESDESEDELELLNGDDTNVDEAEVNNETPEEQSADESNVEIPSSFNLAVPFTPQAPHAIWDLPYQEACEEASAYMVWMYYQGEPSGLIDPDVADAALWDLVDFQNDLFGDYLDTTAEQTREMIDLYYNLNATVVENPTVEQIKAEIAAGRPVIVPAAGQQLGNPYFSGAGPVYHMFVIKGYTEDGFIVNDPGTSRGQNFVYDIDVMMSAIGDWNDGDPANGAKRVIFVTR